MVTIDFDTISQWDELFRRVQEGESVRVTRSGKEIAVIQPPDLSAQDTAYLDALADMGARQIAEAFPANEYDQCDPKARKNGSG